MNRIHRVHIPTARRAGVLSYNRDDWPDHVVYIGRPFYVGEYRIPASPWKNPYSVKRYGRDEAIRRYREHVQGSGELLGHLGELEGKTLACWCKPDERCHGDVLMELVAGDK